MLFRVRAANIVDYGALVVALFLRGKRTLTSLPGAGS